MSVLLGWFKGSRTWTNDHLYGTAVDWMVSPGLVLRNQVSPAWGSAEETAKWGVVEDTTKLISLWTLLHHRVVLAEGPEWPWDELATLPNLFTAGPLEPLLWLDSFRTQTLAVDAQLHSVMATVAYSNGSSDELQPLRAVFAAARKAYPVAEDGEEDPW